MTNEQRDQLRLEREAREVRLGTLRHRDLDTLEGFATARVEVTYQRPGDIERAGHYIVHVPSYDLTGGDELDMSRHPARLAEDRVGELEQGELDYFSIDDVTAY